MSRNDLLHFKIRKYGVGNNSDMGYNLKYQ